MKKFNKFGYAGAIALATAMSFSACSSDDEMENINPTYDGSSVKTQFSISLTQKAKKGGRMANDHAMGTGATFQGLKDIKLYQFTSAVSAGTEASVKLTEDLANIDGMGFNYLATGKMNGQVYNNVEFETGVNNFLFYAKVNIDDNTNEGQVNADYAAAAEAASETTFSPVTFVDKNGAVTNAKGHNFNEAFSDIIAMLKGINDLFAAANLPASVVAEQATLQKITYASSDNVRELLQDIYFSINTQYEGMKTDAPDEVATKALLAGILSKSGLVVSGSTLDWGTDMNPEFPTKWGLPNGAVAVKYASGAFAIATDMTDGTTSNYTKFVYPAPLMFFANSAAGVRNASFFEGKTPSSTDTWATTVQTQFTKGAVSETTRSVILWDEVQYGVAQLATTVKFANSTVKDSKGNDIALNASGFPVTGVLVGDQKAVDWKFEQSGSTSYTLYDGNMTDNAMAAKSSTASAINYTLVYESASTAETSVSVAIEMVNNTGRDFYGVRSQVIPNGAKFYMCAKLDLPASPVTNSIFKQDYVTTANFTIESLKSAYNGIPDLATPKMEFGMSVDLAWKEGLTFNTTIE